MLQSKCFFPAALLFLIGMSLIYSCEGKKDSLPSGIFSKDKMVDVLVDVHLTEAASDNHGLTFPQINIRMANRYDSVFAKHQITYTQFKTSYDYYLQHPDLLADVYAEVVNKLTTMDSKHRASAVKVPPKSLRNDSL